MGGFEKEVMNETATVVEAIVEPASKSNNVIAKIMAAAACGVVVIVGGIVLFGNKRRSKKPVKGECEHVEVTSEMISDEETKTEE